MFDKLLHHKLLSEGSRVGDLDVGCDLGRTHAVIDVPKLNAAKAVKKRAADERIAQIFPRGD
jgi:hypothetical protein